MVDDDDDDDIVCNLQNAKLLFIFHSNKFENARVSY